MVKYKTSNFSKSELPTVGDFVHEVFTRDHAEFTAFNPAFADPYSENFQQSVLSLMNAEVPADKIASTKIVTNRLYKKVDNSKIFIRKADYYVARAEGSIDPAPENFGFAEMRKARSSKNVEAFHAAGMNVKRRMINNQEALLQAGMPQQLIDNFTTLLQEIYDDNQLQNKLMNERDLLTVEYETKINTLWNFIKEVCEAGKIIFDGVSPEKVKDYTFNNIKSRVRHSA